MAQLMLIGSYAKVELTSDPIEGGTHATCVEHSISDGRLAPPGACDWTRYYDTLDDAAEYSAAHADNGDLR